MFSLDTSICVFCIYFNNTFNLFHSIFLGLYNLDQQLFDNVLEKYNLLPNGKSVLVGVSGGPDSIALLSLLSGCKKKPQIICVYVDHGLRPDEIQQEIDHVKKAAKKFGSPFILKKVDVDGYKKRYKSSTEEAARILRYDALQTCASEYPGSLIAVGHTADDQAEEILLRLLRGTGLKGFSGMRMKTTNIIRPLLHFSKSEILHYLSKQGLNYCYDSSNDDLRYTRNRVRKNLLPYLKDHFNPAIQSTLIQTANILQHEEDFIELSSSKEFNKCLLQLKQHPKPEIILEKKSFLQLHEAIKRRVVEKVFWKFDINPTYKQITNICNLALNGTNGSQLHLPSGLRFAITQNSFSFTIQDKNEKRKNLGDVEPFEQIIPGIGIYQIPQLNKSLVIEQGETEKRKGKSNYLTLNLDKITFPLILRPPKDGEKFTPSGMKGRKTIRRFLADQKIDRFQRHLYPVLVQGDRVIAIVGLRVDENFKADSSTRNYLVAGWG